MMVLGIPGRGQGREEGREIKEERLRQKIKINKKKNKKNRPRRGRGSRRGRAAVVGGVTATYGVRGRFDSDPARDRKPSLTEKRF